jgi:hypothetical protein
MRNSVHSHDSSDDLTIDTLYHEHARGYGTFDRLRDEGV